MYQFYLKKVFFTSLVSFSFCTLSKIYIFFNVAIVVIVAVVEAAVGSVELQGERDLLSAV